MNPRIVTIDEDGEERQVMRIPDEIAAQMRDGRSAGLATVFPPARESYALLGVVVQDVFDTPRDATWWAAVPYGQSVECTHVRVSPVAL